MTIEQLETFLAVAEHKGFHHAAQKLYLTQPSVSSRIKTLEKELNVSLFVRHGRYISLSEQGLKLLPYAIGIIRLYDEARGALNGQTLG
ncbi:LysR family transcriptional regulator [Sporolactobacillus terrae]|uniref:LysR family transcriptional regulator n=1 Tax=Sporolactobacillus terrae TaxID=269673 RepID=A0A410D752_9BACL|nr:LysR family transcriptional regulator [Sporolactobacillus terrae]QAA21948.1 LysR family transcriptional regulator [Sporolactobacillus terrae]QAA24921.1 LysR family transcriptional regulator [Sporolactobacillus terrae]UAK16739.1 LysR family transcriptional regulator [Sporolactobacillus terrae]BBN98224.1 hypothetical protein St703_09290 [Sporolactobacillus terrae]